MHGHAFLSRIGHWRVLTRRLVFTGFILAAFAILGIWFGPSIPDIEYWLAHLGFWGPVLFVVLYIPLTSVFFPSNALAFAAGAMFGFWLGYIPLVIGIALAEALQFFIARYWARKPTERLINHHPRLEAVDRAVAEKGLRLMFLLRLAPIPFAPLSYALALSRVRFGAYMVASVGTFLSSIAPVYYGFVAGHVMKYTGDVEDKGGMRYTLMALGVVFAVVASVYVTHVARRAVAEASRPEQTNAAG